MVPPHVPGAERLPVVTPALLAGQSAIQGGQFPPAAEIETRRALDVVAQLQCAGVGERRLPRAGARGIELPAARVRGVAAGISAVALPVFDLQDRASARRGRLTHLAELGLPEAALRHVSPGTLPGRPGVAGELSAPGHGRSA